MPLIGSRRLITLLAAKRAGFSLAAFMAGQEDGFWYDFGQTDRLFQENFGPTPADDLNEVIGLAASQRLWGGQSLAQVLAAAPELATNGDFSSSFGWSLNSGWAVTGGELIASTAGAFAGTVRNVGLVAGRLYAVTYQVTACSAGGVRAFFLGGTQVSGTVRSAPGIYTEYFTALPGNLSVGVQASTGGFAGVIDNFSVKDISSAPASQITTSFKPKCQATGAAFDGADDNLLTGYMAGAAANFIVAKVAVPATVPALQIIAGARSSGAPDTRFYISIDVSGKFSAGVGSVGSGTLIGTADRRGQTLVVGMTQNGSQVRLFEVDTMTYENPQMGSITTTVPLRIGAFNDGGTAGVFYGGSIKSIVAGRQFLDLATFKKIAAAL